MHFALYSHTATLLSECHCTGVRRLFLYLIYPHAELYDSLSATWTATSLSQLSAVEVISPLCSPTSNFSFFSFTSTLLSPIFSTHLSIPILPPLYLLSFTSSYIHLLFFPFSLCSWLRPAERPRLLFSLFLSFLLYHLIFYLHLLLFPLSPISLFYSLSLFSVLFAGFNLLVNVVDGLRRGSFLVAGHERLLIDIFSFLIIFYSSTLSYLFLISLFLLLPQRRLLFSSFGLAVLPHLFYLYLLFLLLHTPFLSYFHFSSLLPLALFNLN